MAHPPRLRAKIAINGIAVVFPITLKPVNTLFFPTRNEAKDRRDDVKYRTDHLKLFDIETDALEEIDYLF